MANKTDGKTGGCTLQWKIENISNCWWLWESKEIVSPAFVADALQGTKWSLSVFVRKYDVLFYLNRERDSYGPDIIEVFYKFAILSKDGSILETGDLGNYEFEKGGYNIDFTDCCLKRKRIFGTERESFLPEDALNVQCKIWIKDEQNAQLNYVFATSTIKVERRSFMIRIGEISSQKAGIRNKFKDSLFGFDVVLNESLEKVDVEISSVDSSINYISCNTWILDSKGSKENCGIKKYLVYDIDEQFLSFTMRLPDKVMENKSEYFKNDYLSFDFEFVLGMLEHYLDCSKYSARLEKHVFEKENPQNVKALVGDLKSLYNERIFSDMELRTSIKTFPVHKNILSARSPVFRRMFSNDMKEKNSGHVDIADFDDDTVQRMLQYLYTASLEDLKFENACKLYEIADKYEILSLKTRCSSFLKENLCPTTACEVFVLAFHHNDEDLNSVVQDYVLREYKQIFRTQEWKEFMGTHLELAADIMFKKLNDSE